MKPANIWLTCLLAVLLQPTARALDTDGTGAFTYESISKRNVFDLKPPGVELPPAPPPKPPANFKLGGVRDKNGSRSVVFYVQPTPQLGKPPPAGLETIIVAEGETNGPIHVIRIANVKTGEMDIENSGSPLTISFKTHGEKLPAAPPAPIPGVPGVVPGIAGMPTPLPMGLQQTAQQAAIAANNNRVWTQTPGSTGAPGTAPMNSGVTRDMRTGASAQFGGGFAGGAGMVAQPQPQPEAQPEQPRVSAEAQIIMMEIERARTADLVAKGQYPPLPPTPLTPQQ